MQSMTSWERTRMFGLCCLTTSSSSQLLMSLNIRIRNYLRGAVWGRGKKPIPFEEKKKLWKFCVQVLDIDRRNPFNPSPNQRVGAALAENPRLDRHDCFVGRNIIVEGSCLLPHCDQEKTNN